MSENRQNELREKVMRHALVQLYRNGIRGVKMDNIAAELQMSKRTLYEMFDDKENLLLESIRFQNEEHRSHIIQFAATADNPLEVFAELFNMKLQTAHDISPQFISDIRRNENIRRNIDANSKSRNDETLAFINECVDKGLFRRDVNFDLVIRIVNITMQAMMEEEFYKEFPFDEILYTYYTTFFRSLCTKRGREILDKTINKYKVHED